MAHPRAYGDDDPYLTELRDGSRRRVALERMVAALDSLEP